MALGRTKITYGIAFGLAPYFKKAALERIQKSDVFVACFDESFNDYLKETQMDLIIRFWDSETKKVHSETSSFISVRRKSCRSRCFWKQKTRF